MRGVWKEPLRRHRRSDTVTVRMDSGADNHYVGFELLPNMEKMRNVKIVDSPMRTNTFEGQVSLGTKAGILQINMKTKDGKTMPLGMRAV